MRWMFGVLIPALTTDARIRFIGNRLDPRAVIVQVAQDKEWQHFRYPIMTQDVGSGLWYVAVTGDGDASMTEIAI